jgi:hypothetical protein
LNGATRSAIGTVSSVAAKAAPTSIDFVCSGWGREIITIASITTPAACATCAARASQDAQIAPSGDRALHDDRPASASRSAVSSKITVTARAAFKIVGCFVVDEGGWRGVVRVKTIVKRAAAIAAFAASTASATRTSLNDRIACGMDSALHRHGAAQAPKISRAAKRAALANDGATAVVKAISTVAALPAISAFAAVARANVNIAVH